jgi:hypothetical protein
MRCACGNEARYIDETGALVCGLCPIKHGHDSIRISDVPALLAWARKIDAGEVPTTSVSVVIGRPPGVSRRRRIYYRAAEKVAAGEPLTTEEDHIYYGPLRTRRI